MYYKYIFQNAQGLSQFTTNIMSKQSTKTSLFLIILETMYIPQNNDLVIGVNAIDVNAIDVK